jgi:hypothetical protein
MDNYNVVSRQDNIEKVVFGPADSRDASPQDEPGEY